MTLKLFTSASESFIGIDFFLEGIVSESRWFLVSIRLQAATIASNNLISPRGMLIPNTHVLFMDMQLPNFRETVFTLTQMPSKLTIKGQKTQVALI